jgi:hypothetical protein
MTGTQDADRTVASPSREPSVNDVVQLLRLLEVLVEQRSASDIALASVLSLLPATAQLDPMAAGRLAAVATKDPKVSKLTRKLAVAGAIMAVRAAKALRQVQPTESTPPVAVPVP